ncbi:adenosine deaminase [Candidatus Spongiihabitans sp.]|uniref:adenosine deaminase n=1 Tax=Candidatus Spongiihabitans sp. TaxID=3101308 RepID=UPI003C70369F
MKRFIQGLPKVELHCHIEGTLEPELMFELAERNGIALPYSSVTELRQAYAFTRLQDFLDIYYQGMNVLQTEQDFFDLTCAYLTRIHAQNVRHTEIFFDPQAHLCRDLSFDVAVNGISRALQAAERDYGISSRVIMCFLRHLDQADAFNTLDLARPYREKIIGVGLDSSERDNPPEKFEQVFAEARSQGYLCVAHAGEEGPPEYIYSALDRLRVNRIDHGNSCLQDPALVERLVAEKMPLTVCPLSNTRLCVVQDMTEHPLKLMLDQSMRVTINSDDPAYFGGYMNENFEAITDALNLSHHDLAQLSSNAIDAAFVETARKHELKSELAGYVWNKR